MAIRPQTFGFEPGLHQAVAQPEDMSQLDSSTGQMNPDQKAAPLTEIAPEEGAATSTGEHSPATGLRDIKSPPEFYPLPSWIPWMLIGMGICFLASYFFSKRKLAERRDPIVPPLERLSQRLNELEQARANKSIALRDLTSEISIASRRFIEEEFSFPAAEQTTGELTRSLPQHLRRTLPMLNSSEQSKFVEGIRLSLRFLEQISFADDSSVRFHLESPELIRATNELRALLFEIHPVLVAERERFTARRNATLKAKRAADTAAKRTAFRNRLRIRKQTRGA